MSQNLATTQDQFTDLSLRKQQLYRQYTNGELSWYQVAEGIEKSNHHRLSFLGSNESLLLPLPFSSQYLFRRGLSVRTSSSLIAGIF